MFQTLRAFFAELLRSGQKTKAQLSPSCPLAPATSLDFEYVDAKCVETCRYIGAKSLNPPKSGNIIVWGYCEQRQAMRCFGIDRMRSLPGVNTEETSWEQPADWAPGYSPNPKRLH